MPANFTTSTAVLNLLRQKQQKQGISYAKVTDPVYRTFNWVNILSLIFCTAINLLYFLGTLGDLNTKLRNKTTVINEIQSAEISAIKNSLIAVGIMGTVMLLSLVFANLKLPLARLVAGLVSAIALFITYTLRLSESIGGGDYSALIWRHCLPTLVFVASLIAVCTVAIRQKHYDRKGCREIEEKIYRQYSISAENVTPEQWQQVLEEYVAEAATKKGKKRRAAKNKTEEPAKSEE